MFNKVQRIEEQIRYKKKQFFYPDAKDEEDWDIDAP